MQMAMVQGSATVATGHASTTGRKLLICQGLDATGQPAGDPMLVVDQLGAGHGDVVVISSDGLGLRELIGFDDSPVRWWTLGIVDGMGREQTTRSS